MSVFIQCECRGVVAHVLLQGFDIIAGFEAVYSEGMPEIVDPVMLQSGLFQDLLEFLPDGRLVVVIAVRIGEDQISSVCAVLTFNRNISSSNCFEI